MALNSTTKASIVPPAMLNWNASGVAGKSTEFALPEAEGLGISLYRPLEAGPRMLRAKLFRAGRPLMLSDVLPLFENMGVEVADER